MKSIQRSLYICLLLLGLTLPAISQESKYSTGEFHVKGVCSMCKTRIENAAYTEGVKFCEWNKESGMIKVIYNPAKTSLAEIHQSIADAGHSTELVQADAEAYEKLPKCCRYNDGAEKH